MIRQRLFLSPARDPADPFSAIAATLQADRDLPSRSQVGTAQSNPGLSPSATRIRPPTSTAWSQSQTMTGPVIAFISRHWPSVCAGPSVAPSRMAVSEGHAGEHSGKGARADRVRRILLAREHEIDPGDPRQPGTERRERRFDEGWRP